MPVVLHVQGMNCGHCVATIKSAVAPLPGIAGVDVDRAACATA